MQTINEVKQLAEADAPLLLFRCAFPSGHVETWSTHTIQVGEEIYSARLLKHNLFNLELSADDAMDGVAQVTITLANADSYLSQVEADFGFKGCQLTVFFTFADVASSAVTTETTVVFRGTAGDPDEISEETLTVTFLNRLNLQRIPVPEVRVQRSCPWQFPGDLQKRIEAKDGGQGRTFSRYFRCGYSADVVGGVGNLLDGQAFTSCDKSRQHCVQRGMFDFDSVGNRTGRFGGFEFVPSAINVRTAGDKTAHISPLLENSAKYNDPVPITYGTGWLKAPVIFARNDGNLTRMEVLAGMGPIQNILKVVVNDFEIPQSVSGQDMTATGWFSVVTFGGRDGTVDPDFSDETGKPLGDPYGSIAVLSVIVPNRISTGKTLPRVELLLQGMQLDTYDVQGRLAATEYSNNPAWVILDLLRRCGWSTSDLDLSTFANSAQFCGTLIKSADLNGNPLQIPRYGCNLILTKRQSAASIIRGIRIAASLMLRYGASGLLELMPETSLAVQQSIVPDGSNSFEQLNGGWPAYEFSDSSATFSGIACKSNGAASLRLTSKTIGETPNRLSVEFQDEFNEYQQDSLSLVDAEETALIGYEIASQTLAVGIPNMNQATRVMLRQLDKSNKGNLFVELQTSFRALKLRPGDLIAVTYQKTGFQRQPFRVIRLSPSLNYQTVTILGQLHNDNWYSDDPSVLAGAGRQPGTNVTIPRPLIGTKSTQLSASTAYFDFGVQELVQAQKDGSATDLLSIEFSQPSKPSPSSPNLPLVSLSSDWETTGGNLAGGTTYYYAVSANDQTGQEGSLSFTVAVSVPSGTNTNSATITKLSFPPLTTSFNVYRGINPQLIYRIASGLSLATSFQDPGLPNQPIGPPDPSFDHANVYYRYEYAGPFIVTAFSPTTIGASEMNASDLAYAGMAVRIIEGTGRGQERAIASNTKTQIVIASRWSVVPDTTSRFVVSDSGWRFGAVASTSPVQFEIPYRAGNIIQISGRSANVHDQEASADLCPITRWALGASPSDAGVPAFPNFLLATPGAGQLVLSNIGFEDLTNVASISSGTLQFHYWNEINALDQILTLTLATPLDSTSTRVYFSQSLPQWQGSLVQIGSELMAVLDSESSDNSFLVARGGFGSVPVEHGITESVLLLDSSTVIVPFVRNFFENRASINYIHPIAIPDVRIAAAGFFLTNTFGDGLARQQSFTATTDGGLRTLSGGQFSLQVAGAIATQTNAAPPLLIEAAHAVRDVRATLNSPATGCTISIDVLNDGQLYCNLVIPEGSVTSDVVSGINLKPLQENSKLMVNVASQPQTSGASVSPGRDLTVTIRL